MTIDSLMPGLMLVHGNQPEALRDLLVSWMRRYPLGPLEDEVILAQSNGIAQWLRLALAADAAPDARDSDAGGYGLGIAAALDISLPARFVWRAYRAVLGPDAVPETSPFDKSRLTWRLMRVLPEQLSLRVYAPLRRFLDDDSALRKRLQLAERLADLFDQYQVYRADWLADWAKGDDLLSDARGNRALLPDEQRWQPALWRALLRDVAVGGVDGPGGASSGLSSSGLGAAVGAGRAAVHQAFVRRASDWQDDQRPAGLPRRVIVFGISSLPRQSLEVLAAIARWSQVLMCIHNPCEHYWGDIIADKDLLRAEQHRQRRRTGMPADLQETDLHLHAQPLLAAWGKQGRDFIGLLDQYDDPSARADHQARLTAIGQRIDLFTSPGETRLLQQLQDDIRELRPLTETRSRWQPVDPARDDSIRFHIAHGPQREVEILHDRLLAALNAKPDLTPRDIMVMVPDIDTYAPHIQAVFGLIDPADPRHIPFSIADQGPRATDPLVHALQILLDLPRSRLAVSDLLGLLEVAALRRRFGIDDDDLPRLHRWIRGANIRWGLDSSHRASLGLPQQTDAKHTWWFGLRRMLLGYAVGRNDEAWLGIEPFDEIGGLEAALVGPLVSLIEQLEQTWRLLREPASVAEWVVRLRELIAAFFDPAGERESYTRAQLEGALQDWHDECHEAGFDAAVPVSVVSESWLGRLEQARLSQRFFGGAVTFATLMPMRAIPFRYVCLLGMNDGDYPRTRVPADFDLMGRDYRPGDRSRREDDRYLFLEALLSAREHLHLSWVGRSITDNGVRPPSVLIGQLRDHLAAGWRLAGDADAPEPPPSALLAALTIEHRLQPFSPAYFPPSEADCEAAADWFTYAKEWRPDVSACSGPSLPFSPALTEPLAPLERDEPLTLYELTAFLKAPVKTFFRERLGVFFELDDPSAEDQEPFALSGLERWSLRDELISAQRLVLEEGGAPARACSAGLARIARRGDLPPGAFGVMVANEIEAPMASLMDAYREALEEWPRALEGEHELRFRVNGDHRLPELADWIGGIRADAQGNRGRIVLEVSDLVKDGKYRADVVLRHWVEHLAGQLLGAPMTTRLLSPAGGVELEPIAPDEAKARLQALLEAWHDGMCRPLPLAAKTAFVWLDGAAEHAQKAYDDDSRRTGEVGYDPYLARVYPNFAALSASGDFAVLAETLLRPLKDAIPVRRPSRAAA